jgi:gluconokinase
MPKNVYIGIDIGTTATKAVVFAANGDVLSHVSRSYPMYHPQPNWSIQKPADLLQAVLECIDLAVQGQNPVFISFSSAMHSLMLVDKKGIPLTDCILWADNRAETQAKRLRESTAGQRMYEKTGIPIHAFSPLTKLLWFKEEEPVLFQQAHKFISAKEYIWHQLTGQYQVDSSMASGTGLMNLQTRQWEPEILQYLNLEAAQLSEIVSPRFFTTGKNLPHTFVIGGGDGPLASLGTGAMAEGKMALTIGTSGAIRLPVRAPLTDPLMRTQCYHVVDDHYLILGAISNGAVVLQWLKENVLQSTDTFEALFEQAAAIPAGADGLVFVPYLLGERAPIWDASAKGSLIGLTINHQQAHFVRAAMEGIVLGLFHIAEVLIPEVEERKGITIQASGGFAQSKLWLQMVADVFQMEVAVAQTVEGSAWGAVLIGLLALGIEIPVEQAPEAIFVPNLAHAPGYAEAFRKYKLASAFLLGL